MDAVASVSLKFIPQQIQDVYVSKVLISVLKWEDVPTDVYISTSRESVVRPGLHRIICLLRPVYILCHMQSRFYRKSCVVHLFDNILSWVASVIIIIIIIIIIYCNLVFTRWQ